MFEGLWRLVRYRFRTAMLRVAGIHIEHDGTVCIALATRQGRLLETKRFSPQPIHNTRRERDTDNAARTASEYLSHFKEVHVVLEDSPLVSRRKRTELEGELTGRGISVCIIPRLLWHKELLGIDRLRSDFSYDDASIAHAQEVFGDALKNRDVSASDAHALNLAYFGCRRINRTS